MGGRKRSVSGLQWAGLAVGAIVIGLTMRSVAAEALFAFADEASVADAMASLNADMAHGAALPEPCSLYILDDLRGYDLFDDATFQSMHRALATNILGADRVDGCTVESQAMPQSEIAGYLEERRASGDDGLVLALIYYKLDDGVTVFANLRNVSGGLLGSSGRFDLPVTAMASSESFDSADADGAAGAKEEPSNLAAPADEIPADPTSLAEQDGTSTQPQQPAADAVLPETELRRQLAADMQIAKAPSSPFNLRRMKAGVPPSIRTVRVVDAGRQDTALMADLAGSFLGTLARTPGSSVETTEFDSSGRRAAKIVIDGEPESAVEAIDIDVADARTAFELILDNDADIVVTRRPISSQQAARFAEVYGVNMRSRYAERVVAIAAGEINAFDCGIRYPQNDMLMSTEDFPTSERVFIYVNSSIPSSVRDQFIDFALSAEGQAVVADHAVDLRLQLSDASYAAWRYQAAGEQEAEIEDVLERFRGLIRTSQRVSSTFRFDLASADLVLDARSEQDLENLIDLVKTRDIDGRRILLFGFADSSGDASFNVDLSRSRADAVAIRLRLAGIPVPPRNVHGIGEDSPIACNVQSDGDRDELGAGKNRRVEVWIES